MNPVKSEKLITRSDFVLIFMILFISVASFLAIRSGSRAGDQVIIEYSGGKTKRPIWWSERFDLEGPLGKSIVEIDQGKVRMVNSPCPEKVCGHAGWISKKGQTIVCLPNHVVIRIDGKSKEKYDAITK